MGQLAKQLADRPSSSFSANTEKNTKEECKAVMTKSRMAIQVDESRAEEKVKMELMVAIKDYLGMKEAKTGTSSCPHGSAVKFWELSGWVGGGEAI